jgi:hypothetical protein
MSLARRLDPGLVVVLEDHTADVSASIVRSRSSTNQPASVAGDLPAFNGE